MDSPTLWQIGEYVSNLYIFIYTFVCTEFAYIQLFPNMKTKKKSKTFNNMIMAVSKSLKAMNYFTLNWTMWKIKYWM